MGVLCLGLLGCCCLFAFRFPSVSIGVVDSSCVVLFLVEGDFVTWSGVRVLPDSGDYANMLRDWDMVVCCGSGGIGVGGGWVFSVWDPNHV